jgi:hypothetical protein
MIRTKGELICVKANSKTPACVFLASSSLLRDSKSLLGIKVGEKIPCTAA